MSENEIKVVWREWFNPAAVKQLEAMGTLPREEMMLDTRFEDARSVAAMIAEKANQNEPEIFREGGKLVILEPEEFAGTFDIDVEYTPEFYASKSDD